MRIAILHYHLRAGGVSRIIDLAVKALLEAGHKVAVIAGSLPHQKSLLLSSRCVGLVSELDYTDHCGDIAALGRDVDALAEEMLGGVPDIWHFHNPTLGKNPMLPMLAARWAEEGRAIVFQLHDFAEQGRPYNYRRLNEAASLVGITLGEFLYPMHPRVRYAVLTSADAVSLSAAGLASRVTVLPNPVQHLPMVTPFPASSISAEEYFVYPTRAITRKNIGEALLWAILMNPGQKLVITLAPEDPTACKEHDLWEAFAKSHDLPVIFDSVTRFGRPLGDFIAGSRAAITTSIREGFGMAYTEPWLFGRPVVGRNLSKVTLDFRDAGLCFDWLYNSIPLTLTTEESSLYNAMREFKQKVNLQGYGAEYQKSPGKNDISQMQVDFGHLDSSLQRGVLDRWIRTGFHGVVLPDLQVEKATEFVHQNQNILLGKYGLNRYAADLEKLYVQVLSGEVGVRDEVNAPARFLDPKAVLWEFINT